MSVDFYSIDKLIEFGMTNSMASQMIQTMNQSFKQMDMPGVSMKKPEREAVYYVAVKGKQKGPYSLTELIRQINEKKVTKDSYIWKPGMLKWEHAENMGEVVKYVAIDPPPVPEED